MKETKSLKSIDESIKEFFEERKKLIQKHRSGSGGLEIVRELAELTDRTIKNFAENSFKDQLDNISIIVLGGYGRKELCFKSDIDISLIVQTNNIDELKEGIEKFYYALLSLKVDVGFSVRNIKTFIELSKDDLTVATSLLQGRYLYGNKDLYDRLIKKFKNLIKKRKEDYIEATLKARKLRYERTGSSIYMMEPHIKEGEGGLRDFHEVYWIAKVLDDVANYKYFVDKKIILEDEYNELIRAYDFLLRIRNEMHIICNKRCDVLVRPLQEEIVKNLGYISNPDDTEQLRESVERLMRLYYLYAKSINTITKRILKSIIGKSSKSYVYEPIDAVFLRSKYELDIKDENKFLKDISNIVRAFLYYKEFNLDFSPKLEYLIRKNELKLLENRKNPEVQRIVRQIFSDVNNLPKTIRKMQEFYVIDTLIPEFGYQRGHFQYDAYHKYTTDEHAIKAVEMLESLLKANDEERKAMYRLFKDIERKDLLIWAVFLHDIGKGHKTDHSVLGEKMAKDILLRFGYSKRDAEIVGFLVRHHLDMAKISQRRNLNDPKIIKEFADIIKNKELLKMLTVLTWSDANAVGPGVWNEWKNLLLWELYNKTLEVLENNVPIEELEKRKLEEKKELLLKRLTELFGEERAKYHLKRLRDVYIISTPLEDMIKHLKMEEELFKTGKPQFYFKEKYGVGASEIIVVVDRNVKNPLLAITGILSYMKINILSVYSYRRKDGTTVIDLLVSTTSLEAIDKSRFERFKELFLNYLNGNITLEELEKRRTKIGYRPKVLPPPTFVKIDNKSSDRYTIFDISGEDRIGLLYDIFKVFSKYHLFPHIAKVSTQGERARDAFYVRTCEQGKLEDKEVLEKIKQDLLKVLNKDI